MALANPHNPHQTEPSKPEAVPLARRETKLGKKPDTSLLLDKQASDTVPEVRSLRVLVVEDDPDTSVTLGMLLDLLGHQVSSAPDGPTALLAARQFRPEVILLDINLSRGMDGYQVARQLRSQEAFRDVLLIAVTGYALEQDRQDALAAGFNFHLPKPFGMEELQRLLASAK
jgi:CheY-like chemotaxis protein